MKFVSVFISLFCLALNCGIILADNRNDATEFTFPANIQANDTPAWQNND